MQLVRSLFSIIQTMIIDNSSSIRGPVKSQAPMLNVGLRKRTGEGVFFATVTAHLTFVGLFSFLIWCGDVIPTFFPTVFRQLHFYIVAILLGHWRILRPLILLIEWALASGACIRKRLHSDIFVADPRGAPAQRARSR